MHPVYNRWRILFRKKIIRSCFYINSKIRQQSEFKILYFSICVVALGIVGGLSYRIYQRYRSLELVNEELRAMFSSSAPGRNATKFREAEFRMEGLRWTKRYY